MDDHLELDEEAAQVDTTPSMSTTVPAVLVERAASRAGHPLLICDDDVLTYQEADRRSAELARGLVAAGLAKGGHLGLLFPNGADFIVGWLAAARIGAVSIPLSTFSTSAELRSVLRSADIEVLLATPGFRNRDYVEGLAEALPSFSVGSASPQYVADMPLLRRVVFDPAVLSMSESEEAVDDQFLAAIEDSVSPTDRMVIVHTSGSSGTPKGVVHRHGPLIEHIAGLNRLRSYEQDEVLFSNSPFFWIGGFAYSLLGTLVAGATLVCSNATDSSATLDLLERVRPTMVNGFAAAVAGLADDPTLPERDLSSIRRGNLWPIMPEDVRAADPELRHNMLGMTETGSVCLASDDEGDQPESRRGSFGRPVTGIETRVVEVDSGKDCGVGAVGELWIRGSAMMEGYYGVDPRTTFDQDGWFRTGDLFHVDADGYFYFHGRYGDRIKTAGANVDPREVEAVITDVTGLEAHVVGIDDSDRGQIVVAAIRVPDDPGCPSEDDLRPVLRERLSAYKVPRRFVFLTEEEVPLLSSGKLDSRGLRDLVGELLVRPESDCA